MKKKPRNYRKEYDTYHGKPNQIKRRNSRNAARRKLKNVKGIKGKDVHHKDGNPQNNKRSNLAVVSKSYNRSRNKKKK